MGRILILTVLVLICGAGEAPAPLPWIPTQLEDWTALAADARAHQARVAMGKIRIFPDRKAWDAGFHQLPLPLPPPDLPPQDGLVVTVSFEDWHPLPGGGRGRGWVDVAQTVVWRGQDGKPMAATVYVNAARIDKAAAAFLSPEAERDFRAQLMASPAPAPGWTIATAEAPRVWTAAWQRPGAKAARIDSDEPVVWRDADRAWLSARPPIEVLPPETAACPDYAARCASHPRVKAALERLHSGFPRRGPVVGILQAEGLAARRGVHIGDVVVEGAYENRSAGFVHKGSAVDFADARFQQVPAASGATSSGIPQRDPVLGLPTMATPLEWAELRLRLARAGEAPYALTFVPGEALGIVWFYLPDDPGMVLLPLVAPAGQEALIDAAVALYASGEPDLVSTALPRCRRTLAPSMVSYLEAWDAARNGRFGQAEQCLDQINETDPALLALAQELRRDLRQRGGRYLLGFPLLAADPRHERRLARLVQQIPEAERFALLDGALGEAAFPADGITTIAVRERTAAALKEGGQAVLQCSQRRRGAGLQIQRLPERFALSMDVVLSEAADVPSHRRSLAIGLKQVDVQGNEVSGGQYGLGSASLGADGSVALKPPDLVLIDNRAASRSPTREIGAQVHLHADGKTPNRLRFLRWRSMQRLEWNGALVYQGFIPPLITPAGRYALRLNLEQLDATISNLRVLQADEAAAGTTPRDDF